MLIFQLYLFVTNVRTNNFYGARENLVCTVQNLTSSNAMLASRLK